MPNPTGQTIGVSAVDLREHDNFTRQFVQDRPTDILFQFPAIQNATGPADLLGQGTGTPALSEINTSEICGLTLDANAEGMGHLWILPYGIDLDEQIDFSYLWSNSEAAGTGTALFTSLFQPFDLGAEVTALAVAATAMGVASTADVDLAANVMQWCPVTSISAGTSSIQSLEPSRDAIGLHIAVTLDTIANATLYAGRVRYSRKLI